MENITSEIREVSGLLDKLVKESENDFISLGAYLQGIVTEIKDLTDLTNKAAGLYQGEDGDILGDIKKSTGGVLSGLTKTRKRIEETLTPFEKLINLMIRLNSENSKIEDASKYLRSVSFNFIIESSIIKNKDDNFRIIADEVKDLSLKISDESKKIKIDSERYLIDFKNDHEFIKDEMFEMQELSENSEKIIDDSIKETEILLNHSLSAIETVNQGTRSINEEIVKIIMAVQLHDNMSQRIEHIKHGLDDIITLVETDKPLGENFFEKEKRPQVAASILKLQCSQLENIVEDLNKVFEENLTAFKGIINEIESFTDSIYDLKKVNEGSFLNSLILSLERLGTIKNKGDSISDHLSEISKQSSETVTNLSSHSKLVRNIGDETHTKALNSIISSEKLGLEGLTLKVLSQEMGVISEKMRNFVNEVNFIMTGIDESSAFLSAESIEKDQEETELIREIIDSLNNTSLMIETDLSNAAGKSDDLKKSIKKTIEDLSFFKVLTDKVSGILNRFEDMDICDCEKDTEVNEFLTNDYFSKRYTMEKERVIHRESVNDHISTTDSASEDSNLGENVDLF